jgi:hypothetical protein
MAKAKVTYLSQDGKEFETELQADARDKFLEVAPQIEAYIVAAGLAKAQAGLMRKHIAGFLVFQEKGVVVDNGSDEDETQGGAGQTGLQLAA